MNYKNKPLWTSITEIPHTYPWLTKNENTSVCIIGSGINEALCALKFAASGVDTILLSEGPIAFNETAFSSGIIKTNICAGLSELSSKTGVDFAINFYNVCNQALNSLENIALLLGNNCGFKRHNSIIYSKSDDASYDLRQEYLIRRYNGIHTDTFSKEKNFFDKNVKMQFGLTEKNKIATVNPFSFAHMIINAASQMGVRIYENTPIENIKFEKDQNIIYTSSDKKVYAEKIIISACRKLRNVRSTGTMKTKFSVVTKPMDNQIINKFKNVVVTRFDYPEITLFVTNDNRIVVTGLQTTLLNQNSKNHKHISTLKKIKYLQLEKHLRTFFPQIKSDEIEYKFFDNYFETLDSLPIVCQLPKYKNCYFNVCSGSDSILFSEITSNIILDLYQKKISPEENPLAITSKKIKHLNIFSLLQ